MPLTDPLGFVELFLAKAKLLILPILSWHSIQLLISQMKPCG
jgi:hypothetical protein